MGPSNEWETLPSPRWADTRRWLLGGRGLGGQQRDLDELLGLLHCDKRQKALLTLASRSAQGQRTSVWEIARRLGIDQKNLSHHLAPLRTAGLIYPTRTGRRREYEITPGRVVYQRDANGHFTRKVFDPRGSGVSVTLEVGGTG